MDILVPSTPKYLTITQTMVEDFIIDPCLGAKVILGLTLDEFQKARLKQYWWVPRVMDSSGYSSFKTFTFWVAFNLRCVLIPDHHSGVYYQNFNAGQQNFWGYYDSIGRPAALFRAQLGRMAIDNFSSEGRGGVKAPSCWTCYFKNSSKIMMPAPGFITDAKNQAGFRLNDLGIDEFTKIESTGSTGIDDQLIGRCTRRSYNQHHPFWCNHHLFLATAEDQNHRSYERYSIFQREIRAGNPDYSAISYSFKDMSDHRADTGKSFKEEFREAKNLKDMKAKATKTKFLTEALGIWAKSGKGWYSGEALDACVDEGRKRRNPVLPLTHRNQDPEDGENIFYFMGADPARAEGKKSDDGALVVIRCQCKHEILTDDLEDWWVDPVWAYKVRKADAGQWASLIHFKNKHFKLSGTCMDHGGGGIWIKPELAKSRQKLNDIEIEVTPITTPDDNTTLHGDGSLIMFSHADDSIRRRWDTLKHADNLIDMGHTELAEAIEHHRIHFPPPIAEIYHQYVEQWGGDGSERIWALRLLEVTRKQLMSITALTDDKGIYVRTRHNAHQFEAKGKKDFAYALVHAYVRFLVWLKFSDRDYEPKDEDAAMCL